MDDSLMQRLVSKIGVAILVIALLDLVYVNWWITQSQKSKVKSQNLEQTRTLEKRIVEPTPAPSYPATTSEPKAEPKTVETKTVVEKQTQTIIQTAQKEIFIPMGSGSTYSNSFADLAGTDVTIDTTKYSSIDSVVFEASIWVEGGNGRAYAQIKNVTDNNPLIESQISSATGSGVVKSSGKIPIPSGAKTYRIQAKTDLTNFAAHIDNARLKIVLK